MKLLELPLFVLFSALAAGAMGPGASGETARDIVIRSIRADNENVRLASRYIYRAHSVKKELDASGKVKSTESSLREVQFIGGREFQHLLEKDGKPLPASEQRKEQARLDKAVSEAKGLSEADREKRFAAHERDEARNRERAKYLPDAFDFRRLPDSSLGGRAVFVIEASPKDAYRGKYDNLYRNVKGVVWIDKADYRWVRVEAEALADISFGLFLAKVSQGSRLMFEQIRIGDEVWLPKRIQVKAVARALIHRIRMEEEITFSDYRKFQTDARVTGVSE